MYDESCALTHDGYVDIEAGVPLAELRVGDRVLGSPDPNDPDAPRSIFRVTAALGQHRVPSDDPGALERFLADRNLTRLLPGATEQGVLVEACVASLGTKPWPALFRIADIPTLDRIFF